MDDSAAEQVWNQLLERTDDEPVDVAGVGSFSVRTYKAYEGRNPRTGERVHVPGKKLPFFNVDEGLRDAVNGGAPTAFGTRLAAGQLVVLGRLGALALRHKGERVGRNPQTGDEILIPARSVVSFAASRQLRGALNGEPAPRIVASSEIDAALASLPAEPLTSLDAFDAAVARLRLDHAALGLVPPRDREAESDGMTTIATEDGELRWYTDGTSVIALSDDGEHAVPIAQWAADMLLVGVVRAAAEGRVLSPPDARRVVARLAPGGLFTLGDLPY